MEISKILTTIKGKVLDATNYELLVSAYNLQQENVTQLKENNLLLREKNEELKEQLSDLQIKLGIHLKELSVLKKEESQKKQIELTKEETNILIFLSKKSNIGLAPLCHYLKLENTKTEYFVEKLLEKKLIYAQHIMMSPTTYALTKNGRKFLVENNLI